MSSAGGSPGAPDELLPDHRPILEGRLKARVRAASEADSAWSTMRRPLARDGRLTLMDCRVCNGPTTVRRTTSTSRFEIRERRCATCQESWETTERETPGTRKRYRAAISNAPIPVPQPPPNVPATPLTLVSDQRSGSDQAPSEPPDQTRTRVESRWPARTWLALFGKAWCAKYGGLAYGGGDATARAAAQLGDILAALPVPDVMSAQARAAGMIAEFLEDDSPKVLKARHPFAFFVTAFTGLRVSPVRVGPARTPEQAEADRRAEQRHQERIAREQLAREEQEALRVQR